MEWSYDPEERRQFAISALMAEQAQAKEEYTLRRLRSPNSGPACVELAQVEPTPQDTSVQTPGNDA